MEIDAKSIRGQLTEEVLNNRFFRNQSAQDNEEFVDWGTANAAQYQDDRGFLDTQAMAKDWLCGRMRAR